MGAIEISEIEAIISKFEARSLELNRLNCGGADSGEIELDKCIEELQELISRHRGAKTEVCREPDYCQGCDAVIIWAKRTDFDDFVPFDCCLSVYSIPDNGPAIASRVDVPSVSLGVSHTFLCSNDKPLIEEMNRRNGRAT